MNASISVVCPTFGRVRCLEEVIQCFLQQNYDGPKELVILNDYYDQHLIYNHPEITIINQNEQITPLSKKYNKLISYTKYDYIAVFEDDDKYLKNHLTYAMNHLIDGSAFRNGLGLVHTGVGQPLHKSGNYFFSSHVFSKKLFEKIGGFEEKPIDNCTFDVDFISKITREVGNYAHGPKLDDIEFIYAWGNGHYHGSGLGTHTSTMSKTVSGFVEQQKSAGRIPTGKIILNPHWNEDYEQMKQKFISENQNGTT